MGNPVSGVASKMVEPLDHEQTTELRWLPGFAEGNLTEYLAAIVNGSDDAIIGKTLDGTIVSWNQGAERLYGYTATEVIGKPITIIAPPERTGEIDEILRCLARGERIDHLETERVDKYGHRFFVSLIISPIRDKNGHIVGASAIARDITDRRKIEAELGVRARQQGAVARLGIMALEGASLQSLLDEAAAVTTTLLEMEMCKILELLPGGDGMLLRSGIGWKEGLVGKAIVGTERESQAGYTLLTDGPLIIENLKTEKRFHGSPLLLEHDVMSGISVIIQGSGRPYGVLGVHSRTMRRFTNDDVHFVQSVANVLGSAVQRSSVEQRLKEVNESLEQRVATRTAQIEEVNRQLREEIRDRQRAEEALAHTNEALTRSNRELQDFAYIASHDLQEPLRKISSFVELLATDYGSVLDKEAHHFINRIQDATRRMADLIRDLLAYSRLVTRGAPFEPVDLNEIVHGVVSDLEVNLKETGGQVVTTRLPVIDADPIQMRQLLQNLIGNALKFRRQDVPPSIQIQGEIGVSATNSNQAILRILVSDNGIGFEEKYTEQIFAPFQRLHGQGEYPGTGMGLAICKRIVERHHGRITASSTPGEGAVFVVELPLVQQPD